MNNKVQIEEAYIKILKKAIKELGLDKKKSEVAKV